MAMSEKGGTAHTSNALGGASRSEVGVITQQPRARAEAEAPAASAGAVNPAQRTPISEAGGNAAASPPVASARTANADAHFVASAAGTARRTRNVVGDCSGASLFPLSAISADGCCFAASVMHGSALLDESALSTTWLGCNIAGRCWLRRSFDSSEMALFGPPDPLMEDSALLEVEGDDV